ncbi:MAG: AAA family ATPase [Crocinitomicaceae bacterium]|nr:AAA family ATPase [Crocinitomicaceae bacterium]
MSDNIPLAERMRPKSLDSYLGQTHLVGVDSILKRAAENATLPSMILWGPPGVGKTTLARILADKAKLPFHQLSAINSGVKEVREVIARAKSGGMFAGKSILFIDEIHRFSKSQQDSLLGAVEQGVVVLIGATTENPSFEVIPALRSRCQIYVLNHLTHDEMLQLIDQAISEDVVLKKRKIEIVEAEALMRASGGDARRLLNILEMVVASVPKGKVEVTNDRVQEIIQTTTAGYDKGGEAHYDIISAFIKSIRASDPNAAVYYLARMIEGGEDPKFIARRLLIAASEDVGNANPTALVLATSTFHATERIGMPEARILLSQCTVYLASSPKSNASYMAINQAQQLVRETGDLQVPHHLRNAPTQLMSQLGYGDGYQYDHDSSGGFSSQECMPESLSGNTLYTPGNNPREKSMREYLKAVWNNKYGY